MEYLKKGRKILCKHVRVKYQFILECSHQFKIKTMCRVLKIALALYYAKLHELESGRTIKISGYCSSSILLMMTVMTSTVIVISR